MPLRIQECEYPSGAAYGVFFMGQHEIGRADKIDGGWRLWRARKVLPEEQAAKAMLDLVRKLGGDIEEFAFLIELEDLNGREKLDGENVFSIIKYQVNLKKKM